MEVCLKYDELADYVIERQMAREISKAEALEIIQQCEEAGLVHMVDNAREEIKHTCNCCGCPTCLPPWPTWPWVLFSLAPPQD